MLLLGERLAAAAWCGDGLVCDRNMSDHFHTRRNPNCV